MHDLLEKSTHCSHRIGLLTELQQQESSNNALSFTELGLIFRRHRRVEVQIVGGDGHAVRQRAGAGKSDLASCARRTISTGMPYCRAQAPACDDVLGPGWHLVSETSDSDCRLLI